MIDSDFTLLDEMKESWGQTFEELNNSERLWLLSSLAGTMTADGTENYDPYQVGSRITDATEKIPRTEFLRTVGVSGSGNPSD